MRIHTFCISAVLALVACGGRPTAPETPNPESYGKTIQPFHQIPASDQEGRGKARSTEEKSNY
ncbi:hypothetical protein [Nitrosomonas sp. Nm166]|uniref:hypothetical protein n=1 Tax=Nitrosomonas sp. Nm166 TaxID=1881054 RepID=UPI0008E8FF8E|nr:hypothetical protein [Nitrosomonas sp. Nm166]SFE37684.1 hypothetical protein SAMN05428977_101444 [Nitrosomonas sp. Nm166]